MINYFEDFSFIVGIIAPVLVFLVWKNIRVFIKNKQYNNTLKGNHVLISGGTSGIGLHIAKQVIIRGGDCTIIGRGGINMDKALQYLRDQPAQPDQKIKGLSLDLTTGCKAVTAAVKDLEEETKHIDMLINCAGMAICGKVEDLTDEDCQYLMDLNYSSSLWLTRAVLPGMKKRKQGRIVLVSSAAALIGVFGLSVYGATKFALRGLAEGLTQELYGSGVTVTVAFPPDTDTPGFAQENKNKPPETVAISESGGIYKPEVVALQIMKDTLNGKAYSYLGMETSLLVLLLCNAGRGFVVLALQYFFSGLIRLILTIYQYHFYRIIIGFKKKRECNKKAE